MSFEEKKKVCCICGKEFRGWGNDPWPVNKRRNTVCCDECNVTKVLEARIKLVQEGRKDEL